MTAPATLPRPPARFSTVAAGLGGLLAVALLAMTVAPPLAAIGAVLAVAVGAFALFRPPLALLLLIAVGPLESAVATAEGSAVTPVKAAGALCFAAFALDALVTQRRLRFDRVHVVLSLLLGLALVSSLAARSTPDAITTTIRYASFAGLYVVATQLADRRLATAVAWVASGERGDRRLVGDLELPLRGQGLGRPDRRATERSRLHPRHHDPVDAVAVAPAGCHSRPPCWRWSDSSLPASSCPFLGARCLRRPWAASGTH